MLKSIFLAFALLVPGLATGCVSDAKDPVPASDIVAPTGDLSVPAGDIVLPTGDLVVTAVFKDAVKTGQNRLLVTVKDEAGATVTGAAVTVDPQMPMHGHGSSEAPVVTEVGDGVYEASPVTFQMPGAWVVHVDAALGTREGNIDLDVTVP